MKTQIKMLCIAAMVFLVGCDQGPRATQMDYPVLPEELKDCKFFNLSRGAGTYITVGRCPNSTTTVQMSDKARTTTVLIDGKEYIRK